MIIVGVFVTALSAVPTKAWGDCWVKMIEHNCQSENTYFSARTFGSYETGCPLKETTNGLMTIKDWNSSPIKCELSQPVYSTLKDIKISLELDSFYPAQSKGMCMGADQGTAVLKINGETIIDLNGTHGEGCVQKSEHLVQVTGSSVKHCKIANEELSDETPGFSCKNYNMIDQLKGR